MQFILYSRYAKKVGKPQASNSAAHVLPLNTYLVSYAIGFHYTNRLLYAVVVLPIQALRVGQEMNTLKTLALHSEVSRGSFREFTDDTNERSILIF